MWLPSRIPCWGGHWANRLFDVDGMIRRRFGGVLEAAAAGELDHWTATPSGRLALVIVLDQLSRNIHRDTPQAFAQDAKTLPIVQEALAAGEDQLFNPLARTLFYLPLMHHENLLLLERCIALYEDARIEARGLARKVISIELASGRRHHQILARFGRYPHRNRILGRDSTPAERRFLNEAFSTF